MYLGLKQDWIKEKLLRLPDEELGALFRAIATGEVNEKDTNQAVMEMIDENTGIFVNYCDEENSSKLHVHNPVDNTPSRARTHQVNNLKFFYLKKRSDLETALTPNVLITNLLLTPRARVIDTTREDPELLEVFNLCKPFIKETAYNRMRMLDGPKSWKSGKLLSGRNYRVSATYPLDYHKDALYGLKKCLSELVSSGDEVKVVYSWNFFENHILEAYLERTSPKSELIIYAIEKIAGRPKYNSMRDRLKEKNQGVENDVLDEALSLWKSTDPKEWPKINEWTEYLERARARIFNSKKDPLFDVLDRMNFDDRLIYVKKAISLRRDLLDEINNGLDERTLIRWIVSCRRFPTKEEVTKIKTC